MQEEQINGLVIVEQLPVIKQHLQIISDEIEEEIKYALSLECTEESKTVVKEARSKLNKIKTALEEKRKAVKSAVLTPYEEFEVVYNELVKDKLVKADATLKIKIDNIEIVQKAEKDKELREFYDEYIKKYNLEDLEIPFDCMGLNVTLSASMKSLKEKIVEFCDKIANDLKLIELEEYKDEIMLEFKNLLNFASAKMKVVERHKQLELMKQREEELARKKEEEAKIVEKVEEVVEPEIIAPVEVETTTLADTEEQYVITFTVHGTKEQIMKLKQFLNEEGLRYE